MDFLNVELNSRKKKKKKKILKLFREFKIFTIFKILFTNLFPPLPLFHLTIEIVAQE